MKCGDCGNDLRKIRLGWWRCPECADLLTSFDHIESKVDESKNSHKKEQDHEMEV